MLRGMPIACKIPGRHGRYVLGLAALLVALSHITGCVSAPATSRVSSRQLLRKPVTLDPIVVTVTSAAGEFTAEKQLLSDALLSGLKQTAMFATVTGGPDTGGAGAGVTLQPEIITLKKVSENARAWAGALAGQARMEVRVTVADRPSGQPIEVFIAEGVSGKSAFAGTTDEAIQQAAQQIVAEILKLNTQSSQ